VAVHIGTSGWNYKHWREIFYPKGVPQKNWLRYLAAQFDTVEINTSFYRIPKTESVAQWQCDTPPQFRFAVKLWRGITHYRKLMNSQEFLRRFFDVFEPLDEKRRAPLLVQLPPNLGRNTERLKAFFDDLRAAAPSTWKYAVEFRNNSWLTEEVYSLLDDEGAALCVHDMRDAGATDTPNAAPFVYIRRHGSGEGKYAGSYSNEQIRADASRISSWHADGKDVFVYYNNDIGGHALENARQLKQKLTRSGIL
jgi:uncharacterized protein YecE (DUF72 family)